jgi:lipoprotein-anchoring transpeptidase ErfK/SrfK
VRFQRNEGVFAVAPKEKSLIKWKTKGCIGLALLALIAASPSSAQYYPDAYYPPGYGDAYGQDPEGRDAEMILQDQIQRSRAYGRAAPANPGMEYDNYYGHRIHDEAQVRAVMSEARHISGLIRQRNGKPYLVVDKRNVQFYLYDREGRLLRIGPVAIGKGKTNVGAFETPVGIFSIKSKTPVDDWIRPDWYFIEEGEPIPKKWEDRRVPGFFRYKLVFDGSRYVHYAEATGGRLTHGCLGLDWQDAEAVFHTMQVGSYCIILDQGFLNRLAKGEFPVQKPVVAKKPDEGGVSRKPEENSSVGQVKQEKERRNLAEEKAIPGDDKTLQSLW